MYLSNYYVLFLLAFIACQAARLSKVTEQKSIDVKKTTFIKNGIDTKDTGMEKDRIKKSASAFCVEVRSENPEQESCQQDIKPQNIKQESSKPMVIVQPMPVAAVTSSPFNKFHKQPVIIQEQPQFFQPTPQYIIPASVPQAIAQLAPESIPQSAPRPVLRPISQLVPSAPAPKAPISIIHIIPSVPALTPCDKATIVQPKQPQIHNIIDLQSQQVQRSSTADFRRRKQKPLEVLLKDLPFHTKKRVFITMADVCKLCEGRCDE